MIEKPKNLCFLIVIVTFCISLCTADDLSDHQEEGRALSLKAAQHPAGKSYFFDYAVNP